MANTYTFTGPGTRWAEGNPTAEDLLNIARINIDHLHEALNELIDTDNPVAGIIQMKNSIDANVTIAANYNAVSAGPISIASGVKVTVPSTSRWTIV